MSKINLVIPYNPYDINALVFLTYDEFSQENSIAKALSEFHKKKYRNPKNFTPFYCYV
jgi:hypothetical protein